MYRESHDFESSDDEESNRSSRESNGDASPLGEAHRTVNAGLDSTASLPEPDDAISQADGFA